jgi:hypothetical protein
LSVSLRFRPGTGEEPCVTYQQIKKDLWHHEGVRTRNGNSSTVRSSLLVEWNSAS